jgi:hypothetical protein
MKLQFVKVRQLVRYTAEVMKTNLVDLALR